MAEWLALLTSDYGVAGSNPAGGEILPEPKRRFIAQSLSCSPFHCLEMIEILLKGCKTLTHPSILNLIQSFWLIGMPIVWLTCQNRSCISKLISEWKLYQLNHNLILLTIITEKVSIKRVMQIHNIIVLIFITCAVINHLFFTLSSMSVMHFFFFFFLDDSSPF